MGGHKDADMDSDKMLDNKSEFFSPWSTSQLLQN